MSKEGFVIVTGGASGIGLAAAEALLAEGWGVLALDVVPANIETARGALAHHGGKVRFAQLDVSDEGAVTALFADLPADLGPLRGVVNSAGIARDIPALDTSAEIFRKILDVNVVGSFLIAREAARAMKDTGGGAIVNIASVSGLKGNLGRSAYGSSKGAVVMLTKILAVEFAAFGIRVNAIAPGPVDTPLVQQVHTSASRAMWTDRVPLHRYADPSEMAGAIAFLLDGAKSSFVTGQTLAVDGGFSEGGLIG